MCVSVCLHIALEVIDANEDVCQHLTEQVSALILPVCLCGDSLRELHFLVKISMFTWVSNRVHIQPSHTHAHTRAHT